MCCCIIFFPVNHTHARTRARTHTEAGREADSQTDKIKTQKERGFFSCFRKLDVKFALGLFSLNRQTDS